jgi:tRNA threonylcarbamoyl adenosine modification protein YeaZ
VLALVIDTSSAAVTAGLVEVSATGVDVLAQRVTVDARAHGELLAPQISACFDAAGRIPAQLGAVVAGLGPGPFTGLRVGLVTAAMFGDLLGIPTYGVCSLDAVAAFIAGTEPLLVAGDARRKEIYWARYENGTRVAGPSVHRPADLPGLGTDRSTAGAGARLFHDRLGGELLDCDYPPVAAVAGLGADRILGRAASETLVPLYLRRPDAVAPTDYKTVTPS